MKLKLKCPNCRQKMLYEGKENTKNKRKKCVYCGKSFSVNYENIWG